MSAEMLGFMCLSFFVLSIFTPWAERLREALHGLVSIFSKHAACFCLDEGNVANCPGPGRALAAVGGQLLSGKDGLIDS